MISPIIFIHRTNSDYLKYTIQLAKISNPEKEIFFLGDTENAYLSKFGAKHFLFSDYDNGEKIENFHKVFKIVAGSQHGREKWLKFVFQRWYHICNFIEAHEIESFWTFDSDTLILTDLSLWENRLSKYDCTEQCEGMCMNGFVSNKKVVYGYVKKMNELFVRNNYIKKQEADFVLNPTYAYTEMRAYETYKQEENLKTIHIGSVQEESIFDDCLCYADEMETYNFLLYGNKLKTIYWRMDGIFFFKHEQSNKFIRINTLNMSWVPTYLYSRIIKIAAINYSYGNQAKIRDNCLELNILNIKPPLSHHLWVYWNIIKSKLSRFKHTILEKSTTTYA